MPNPFLYRRGGARARAKNNAGNNGKHKGQITGFRGALVRKAANQATADYATAPVIVAWDQETYDTEGFHDNSSNNSRLTVPPSLDGGYVVVSVQIQAEAVGINNDASIEIFKNGAIFDGTSASLRAIGAGVTGTADRVWVEARTHVIQVNSGDYFEARLRISPDTSVTIVAASSSFAIRVVGTSIAGAIVKSSGDLTTQNYSGFPLLAWNAEVYDTDGFHDNVTNNSRLTVPAAYDGRYAVIKVSVRLSLVGASSTGSLQVLKNGAAFTHGGVNSVFSSGSGTVWVEVESQPILLATGDYFEIQGFCNDTSVTRDANGSFFSIEILPTTFQGVVAVLNADATANYTTATALAFDGADLYDTDAAHDPASNNTKIIVPAAFNNKYGVLVGVVSGTNDLTANSSASVGIYKAGSASYDGFGGNGGHNGSFTQPWCQARTQPILLATGDEFTMQFWNSSDTSVTLESTLTSFGLRIVG